MASMAEIIARNIKDLMEEHSVSIVQLSEIVGISRQTMAKYLEGQGIIDSDKLYIISKYFHKPLSYFLEESHNQLSFMFRADNPTKNFELYDKNRIESIIERVTETYKLAGEKVHYLPEQYSLAIEGNPRNLSPELEEIIERIALEQREALDATEAVGEELIKCFENKGINVIFEPMNNNKLFGISAYHEQKGCFIIINDDKNITEERKIFSLVHEFAHLIFNRDQYSYNQEDLKYTSVRNNINEKIANSFAGYFLIPRYMLKKYDNFLKTKINWDVLFLIKKELQVSLMALIHALKNYGYITELKCKEVINNLYKNGLGQVEPEPIQYIQKNQKFNSVVKTLYLSGVIGVNKVAELLNMKVIETRRLINGWHSDKTTLQEFVF